MSIRDAIPVDILRRLISYDDKTGVLRWKDRLPTDFQCEDRSRARVCNGWNSKYSGKPINSRTDDGRVIVHLNLGKRMRTQGARVAWAIYHGKWPKGVIDHIDGDCTNDRIENLRDVSLSENNRNQRISGRNTSGKVGVTFNRGARKWRAWVSLNGRVKSLGYFWTLEEAISARRAAEDAEGFFEATRVSETLKYRGAA